MCLVYDKKSKIFLTDQASKPSDILNLNDDFITLDDLINMSRKDIIDVFGLQYNDIYSDVWIFRLRPAFNIFKMNYLYLIFNNDLVCEYYLKRFKRTQSVL